MEFLFLKSYIVNHISSQKEVITLLNLTLVLHLKGRLNSTLHTNKGMIKILKYMQSTILQIKFGNRRH